MKVVLFSHTSSLFRYGVRHLGPGCTVHRSRRQPVVLRKKERSARNKLNIAGLKRAINPGSIFCGAQVAHHLPQARFDVYERRCQPAWALARVLPVGDLRAAFLDESTDGLKAVRRLERTAQHRVHAESMQRQRLPRGLPPGCQLRIGSALLTHRGVARAQ